MSGNMIVTKTHGKKSVGGINRIVMIAQYFDKKLEKEAKYQWELSEYLNSDICQPEEFDAYGYPSELFKLDMERLGIIVVMQSKWNSQNALQIMMAFLKIWDSLKR